MATQTPQPQEPEKVKWAPLSVPIERRVQTLAVLFWALQFFIILGAFFLLALFPSTWPVLIPYVCWVVFIDRAERKGGRRVEALRNMPIWTWFVDYFPIRLHKTADVPPTRPYIFGYHPHGVISLGAWGNFATNATGFSKLFPGIKLHLCTLDPNFRWPFTREYLLGMGLVSVDRKSLEYVLHKGESAMIVIGGAEEAAKARPFTNDLVLGRRFGFVKLALRYGAWLVPVFSFGEGDIWDIKESETGDKISHWTKKYFGVTLPLIFGRGVFNYNYGIMPYRRAINTVVGEPLEMPHIPEPTEEQVREHHDRYVAALKKVWDANKDVYAKQRRRSLRLVE
ncbi:DAGAT-domain-containing protein [Gonapodya prolifera JEL478]|uniref:Diacylglycerol O-acyltransferase n=1 Tax=Gonapodya prolifera (strain JEL478) TaxID=1344416 RepID=A0A139ASE2_GONPJ|nr:DAGAT-domain-containing protein [Gonapodya prolifera JEL478]|eukprot:KXS19405.1 DAGAT-domain-containing protein [Gonapodya prolifera JEL478]